MLYWAAIILKWINLVLIYCVVAALLLSPFMVLILGFYLARTDRVEYPNRTVSTEVPAFNEIQVYSIDFNKHTYLIFSGELQPDAAVNYSHLSGVVHSPDCTNPTCIKNRSAHDVRLVCIDEQNSSIDVLK